MSTTKFTIRLSSEDLRFLKDYVKQRKMTATAIILRYLSQLKSVETSTGQHSAVDRITGLLPADLNVEQEYIAGVLRKHHRMLYRNAAQ